MAEKVDLRNLTLIRLIRFMAGLGFPEPVAVRVFSALQRAGVTDFSQMTTVRRDIRFILAEKSVISKLVPLAREQSRDGTQKFVFRLADGAVIESVLIPENGRHTLCVSSQCGCAMDCGFCLTGRMGFIRNLSPAEIVGQVLAVIDHMRSSGIKRATPREYVNNLVFMGMGEPLANYDNLLTALAILMDGKGLEFTERRVTVSTCGLAPRIIDLGRDVRVNLAVSLHAADDHTRSLLMPINRRYPVGQLLAACRSWPLPKKRVILFEYILIRGINDGEKDARLLAEKLQDIPCRINLLPYNESDSLPYERPDDDTVLRFSRILRRAGFTTIVRSSRGADISAACGQLASCVK